MWRLVISFCLIFPLQVAKNMQKFGFTGFVYQHTDSKKAKVRNAEHSEPLSFYCTWKCLPLPIFLFILIHFCSYSMFHSLPFHSMSHWWLFIYFYFFLPHLDIMYFFPKFFFFFFFFFFFLLFSSIFWSLVYVITVLFRGVRSLFGPTRKSSPWGNFSNGGSFVAGPFGWLIDWR